MFWLGLLVVGALIAMGLRAFLICRKLRDIESKVDRLPTMHSHHKDRCVEWTVEEVKLSADACQQYQEKLYRALVYYCKLEDATPDQEKWKLCIGYTWNPEGLVPDDHLLPSEFIRRRLRLLRRIEETYHLNKGEENDEDR